MELVGKVNQEGVLPIIVSYSLKFQVVAVEEVVTVVLSLTNTLSGVELPPPPAPLSVIVTLVPASKLPEVVTIEREV